MSIRAEIFPLAQLPPEVRDFWSTRAAEQDPALALVASPEWLEMMCGDAGDGVILAAYRGTQPVCVLPCRVQSWTLGFRIGGRTFGRRVLTTAKVLAGDLIEEGLAAGELEAALAQAFDMHPSWDALLLDHVPTGPRYDLVLEAARPAGRLICHPVSPERPHYRLKLPETYEEFRQIRSSKSLSKIFGRERAMERAHDATSELVEFRAPADWAPHAERIEELMRNAWQAHALGHEFTVSDMETVADRGWNRSFMLTLGGTPVAFAFCYQGMGTLTYAQIGYDPGMSRYSPGATLLYRLIERLYESDRPACIDFGEGEGDYKKQLANDVLSVASVLVARASLSMSALMTLHRASVLIDRLTRRAVKGSAIGRKLRRMRRKC